MTVKVQETNHYLRSVATTDTFFLKCENAGSPDLSVNGAITPVEFILPLPVGTNFLLQAVSFVVGADDVVDPAKFGNIAALANGLLFEINGGAVNNFTDNGDILLISNTCSIESVVFAAVASGVLFGQWDITESFGGNSARVYDNALKITVRDDLSTLPYFRVSVHGVLFEDA